MSFFSHRSPFAFRRRRAVVLILAFWIAIILAMIAYSVAYELRLNLRMVRESQDVLRATALARAGVAKAVVDLRNDRLIAVADPVSMNTDSPRDVWAMEDDKTDVELGGGVYTVRIEDEDGKFNLDGLTRLNVTALGYILHKVARVKESEGDMLALMLLDYQDPDRFASGGAGETETEVYTEYMKDNFGKDLPPGWTFRPKNDRLVNLDQLLDIPFFTPDLLYGSAKVRAEWENTELSERREESPILSDYITVRGGTRLNLNTMPSLIFAGLIKAVVPAGVGGEIGEQIAEKFQTYRLSLRKADGNRGMILQLLQLRDPAVGLDGTLLGKMESAYPMGASSNFFKITSTGEYNGSRKRLQYRVRVDLESYPIDLNDPAGGGKRDRRASGSLRNRSDTVLDPAVRVYEIRDF